MTEMRRILCLAASTKHNGFCYAGKDVANGKWVRPISDRPGHEISHFERLLSSKQPAAVLDVIDVSLLAHAPTTFQAENYINNPQVKWSLVGTATYSDAVGYLDPAEPLWVNGPSSSYGLHDQIPTVEADQLTSSLRLIKAENLVLVVQMEGGTFGPARIAVRAKFKYLDEVYWLKMTDPVLGYKLRQQGIGQYKYDYALLCISLGESFNGYAYKLVASVILP